MKLLVAGDSFTYGHNLKDRHLNSWPNQLNKRLGYQLIDKSKPGVSNQYIITTVMETLHTQNIENVIIGFTDVARYELFQNNDMVQIVPNRKIIQNDEVERYNQLYFKNFYNELYLVRNFINQVAMLESFLKVKKINYTFFNAFGNRNILIENYKKINLNVLSSKTFLGWPYDDMNNLTENFDRLPCGHPDVKAHEFWADILYDFLNNKEQFKFKFQKLTGRQYQ
jgi:hypothetical protein